MNRRDFTFLLAAAAGTSASWADDEWPARPISLITPYAPGTGADITYRQIAERLAVKLRQPVTVVNRTGGGAVIGHVAIANAKPDGYTIGGVSAPLVSNPATMKEPQVIFGKQLVAVGLVSHFYLTVVGRNNLAPSTLPELVEHAKRSPTPLRFGTLQGGSVEFAKMLVEQYTGVKFTPVYYRGTTDILRDVLGGHVDLGLLSPQNVPAGTVKTYTYLGKTRATNLPNVPTLAETYGKPEAAFGAWNALVAPADTPKPILAKLSAALKEVMADPTLLEYLRVTQQNDPAENSSPEFMTSYLNAESALYRELARRNNVTPE